MAAVRYPAVSGTFYEETAARLESQVDECFAAGLGEGSRVSRERFIGAVVPHAGLVYSGHVAAAFYSAAELPKRLIILCPNHTGQGHFAAISSAGSWRTPLGDVPVDSDLAARLMAKTRLLTEDSVAHAREHSLEVQLPFLQRLGFEFSFVPICLGAPRYDVCEEIGTAIADVIASAQEPVGIVASSDFNHYENQQETLRKDQLAIDQVLARDPKELWRVVEDEDISMCGYIPTTTMLIAANRLGASKATLLRHATSGDINHDYRRVVGYAAIMVS